MIFPALVALKLLVSLISRLVACSARIVADKQTDRHAERLRCACAPRVNNKYKLSSFPKLCKKTARNRNHLDTIVTCGIIKDTCMEIKLHATIIIRMHTILYNTVVIKCW